LLRTDFVSDLYLHRIRINKEARENVRLAKTSDSCANNCDVSFCVESTFSCYLIRLFSDKRHCVWPGLKGDLKHFFRRCHFQVQISGDDLSKKLNILILDVTPIASQVHSDSVCSCLFADNRGSNDARLRRSPRLPHGTDVIDVDV
jgi:hypothetical protein